MHTQLRALEKELAQLHSDMQETERTALEFQEAKQVKFRVNTRPLEEQVGALQKEREDRQAKLDDKEAVVDNEHTQLRQYQHEELLLQQKQ